MTRNSCSYHFITSFSSLPIGTPPTKGIISRRSTFVPTCNGCSLSHSVQPSRVIISKIALIIGIRCSLYEVSVSMNYNINLSRSLRLPFWLFFTTFQTNIQPQPLIFPIFFFRLKDDA